MSQYFLTKTGWQFFDVSRAYGLGIILDTLADDAVVSDRGAFYYIRAKNNPDFNKIDTITTFLGNDQNWNWCLQTLTGKDKKSGKGKREIKREEVIMFLTDKDNVMGLLEKFSKIRSPSTIGRGSETLYQSMELAATKGVRESILKSYSEGSNVPIHKDDFCLSILGHLNFNVRKKLRENNRDKLLISVIPTPLNTKIGDVLEIYKMINEAVKGVHRAGWFPSVAHIAVNLVFEEIEVKKGGKFSPQFGSLIYGIMTKTGNQWKPFTGGIFPLDFLHQIAKSNEAKTILNTWKKIFDWTAFRKGYEDIATALAEFIGNPTLTTYERYVKLYLRNELSKDRIKFGSYEKEILGEVISNVGI